MTDGKPHKWQHEIQVRNLSVQAHGCGAQRRSHPTASATDSQFSFGSRRPSGRWVFAGGHADRSDDKRGETRCVLYVARECQTSRGRNPCNRKRIPGTRSASTATSQRQGQPLPPRSPAACRRDSLVERSPWISTSLRCKAQGSSLHRECFHNFHAPHRQSLASH